jgi:hypothetical protein
MGDMGRLGGGWGRRMGEFRARGRSGIDGDDKGVSCVSINSRDFLAVGLNYCFRSVGFFVEGEAFWLE